MILGVLDLMYVKIVAWKTPLQVGWKLVHNWERPDSWN